MGGCCATKSNKPKTNKPITDPPPDSQSSPSQALLDAKAKSSPEEPNRSSVEAAPVPVLIPTHYKHTGKTVFYYYDLHARGDVIRLLLHLTDVPFEDIRFTPEEWRSKYKSLSEFGTCPILAIDGHKLVQTEAIMRYVAQMHGLYPKSQKDVYLLESMVEKINEMKGDLVDCSVQNDEKKKEECYEKTTVYLKMLEQRLLNNPARSGWVIGGQITLADICLFDFLWNWYLQPSLKETHGHRVSVPLKKFAEFCLERYPRLRDYITSRQNRPF